jgi:hypothetical protein
MATKEMYYNRKLSDEFSKRIEPNGDLRWLFDFVRDREDLDFLIGKNAKEEWISIYRGLSRCIKIDQTGKIDAADEYKKLNPCLYDINAKKEINFQNELSELLSEVKKEPKFDSYYKNKKEGYYQNEISRKYGMLSDSNSEFVIIDKEAVVGYDTEKTKEMIFGKMRENYKDLQKEISKKDAKRYGKDLHEKKSLGDELDFLALDKDGNVLLIEFKHGSNTSGIYLSPLQIGLYYDIFTKFPKKDLEEAVFSMLEQKQKIGLISPLWKKPDTIKEIKPVLIISEYNYKGSAKEIYPEIMEICRNEFGMDFLSNIETYNYTNSQLKPW